ncbi:hypothetical protein C7S16_6425 [Burkholderia thailandensis]|uniref:Uncharacterized protein n=1 Tax=Burkholderia thailandensis TaxID=57975 RepID=A0AAW9CUX0_BURTH|nr:hypothetical protein [Burkholderia thailandensis]
MKRRIATSKGSFSLTRMIVMTRHVKKESKGIAEKGFRV